MTSPNHTGGYSAARPHDGGTSEELTVQIAITKYISEDYARRGAFTDILRERALISRGPGRPALGTTYLRVSHTLARAVGADAQSRYTDTSLSRGDRVAYKSLFKRVARAFRQIDITGSAQPARQFGTWIDPGLDEARSRAAASPAQMEVGEAVLYFYDSESELGREATLTESYQMFKVAREDGAYVTGDGRRLAYKSGYLIRLKSTGEVIFAAAHQLTREDCKPSHLRLIQTASLHQAAEVLQ